MSKAEVSNDFNKFLGKAAAGIEDAKKAENTMGGVPLPIGWEGKCVLLSAKAAKAKDKKQQDGSTKPGNPYVRFEFGVVDDPKYQGKKFSEIFVFFDSQNATAVDRYTWFLNFCENLGLPREMREEQGDNVAAVLDHLLESEAVFEARCVEDSYQQDGKKVQVRASADPVDGSSSMTPTTSSQEIAEGSEVEYLGSKWTILAIDGDHVQIQKEDGKQRTVKKNQLAG